MSTPTHRIYFLVLRPEQVNGRLVAHLGKLLLNLLNYSELLVAVPPITDESLQVFEVEVPLDLVQVQPEGDRVRHLLWAGEKYGKHRPNDLVTISIRSMVPFVSDAAKKDPTAIAGATFAGFPPAVQLAATILSISDEVLGSAGINPTVRAWAQDQVTKQSAAAGA